MQHLKLIYPNSKYLASYTEAYQEDVANRYGDDEFLCPPDIVISQARNYRHGKNMQPGFVRSTMLWMVTDDQFVGCVDIRHTLTDNLLSFGGHIGYEVRYSCWNKGYGTVMLALALRYAKRKLHLSRVLITCDVANLPSACVIEKNGGVLENITEAIDEKGKPHTIKRYWVDIR